MKKINARYKIGFVTLAIVLPCAFFITMAVQQTSQTCPLESRLPYKDRTRNTVFYITDSCTKQAFKDPPAYFRYFTSWNQVRVVDRSMLDNIPDDENYWIITGNGTSNSQQPTGCSYNNPACSSGYDCIDNQCQLIQECTTSIQCHDEEICSENRCVKVQMQQIYNGKIINLRVNKFDDSILAYRMEGEVDHYSFSLIYSEDQGKTWIRSQGIPSSKPILFTYDNFTPRTVYAASLNVIYKSIDGGKNFTQVGLLNDGAEDIAASIFADRFISGKIYIGNRSSGDKWGIYVSNNGGRSFQFFSIKDSITDVVVDPRILTGRITWDITQDSLDSHVLYITSEEGMHFGYQRTPSGGILGANNYDPYYIMRTSDGGRTWEPLSSGLPWHSTIIRSYLENKSNTTKIIVGTEGSGLYFLNKTNKTWTRSVNVGVCNDYLVDKWVHFLLTKTELRMSEDEGTTWAKLIAYHSGDTSSYFGIALDSKGNLFISDLQNGIKMISGLNNL